VDVNEKDQTVTVYPEEGNFPAIARALLEAADHPYQVRSVSHPRAGFEVPEDVYDRFQALMNSTEDPGGAVEDVPRKRRPGRPRKPAEPAATPASEQLDNNNDSGEEHEDA
jgi:hypothetical protein